MRRRDGEKTAADGRVLEARILSVGSRGDGVAEGPLYVSMTLPGELAAVRAAGERGSLERILERSPERVQPPCPHFGDCGGCALQHWRSEAIASWKREQVVRALARVGLAAQVAVTATVPPASRRRVALHARRVGSRVALGFKAARSWRLVEIGTCLVAVPPIVAALPMLARLATPFLESPRSAPTLHVTATETGLDVEVSGVEAGAGGLSADARREAARLAQEADLARLSLGGETLFQSRPPVVVIGGAAVAPPAGAFLQPCAQAQALLASFIAKRARGARRLVDLFCGIGTLSLPLAADLPVVAMDASAEAVRALARAAALARLNPVVAEARDLFRRPLLARDVRQGDLVVFDPPRAGAAAQADELARSKALRIIAVSCNPATFARDAARLAAGGWRIGEVLPLDQFLWSPHIELAAVFERG